MIRNLLVNLQVLLTTRLLGSGKTRKSSILRILLILGGILIVCIVYLSWLGKSAIFGSWRVDEIQSVKIHIFDEGMYEIEDSELEELGLRVLRIDLMNFRLTHRGRDVPLWIVPYGAGYRLRFYAITSDSHFMEESIYILTIGNQPGGLTQWWIPSSPMVSHEGNDYTEIYPYSMRFEENLRYFPQVTEGDHWFWETIAMTQEWDFNFTIEDYKLGEVQLRLGLWSVTQDMIAPDHHILVNMNGASVVDEYWDGAGRILLDVLVPHDVFFEGDNNIHIELPGDTGADAEIIWLDYVEVVYPRLANTNNHRLFFDGALIPLKLSGMEGEVALFDITNPFNAQLLLYYSVVTQSVIVQRAAEHRYLTVDGNGFLQPDLIEPLVIEPDLHSHEIEADYLMISPSDFIDSLKPLFEYRESQGLRSLAIPSEAIFDQFGDGYKEPEAIRSFLIYASRNWNIAPKFVFLIGDATYDPRGYISPPEANRVPTFFIMTDYGGQTTSDVMFAQLDQDDLPDVAVGRIPAQTTSQVEIYIQKILYYENQRDDLEWRNRIFVVADGQESAFLTDAQQFIDIFTQPWEVELYNPSPGLTDAPETIASYLNDGYALMAYFGHGGVVMWGKDRLFTVEDIVHLANPTLPVVINMTCLTGLFTHPSVVSFAEALLWQPNGGAIAVLAPTSLTLPSDQSFLSQSLANEIVSANVSTLGEILLNAQRRIPPNVGTQEVLMTFLLFGDPAIRLPVASR